MRIRLEAYELPLHSPLITAAGTFTSRRGWIIRLKDAYGHRGVGDAAPLPGFSKETHEQVGEALSLWAEHGFMPELPSARHGIEQATLSLQAVQTCQSLSQLLGATVKANVPVARLVRSVEEAVVAVQAGAQCLKLKVGALPLAEDIARVQALREAVGPAIAIRLDANQGWSFLQAQGALTALAPFAPEFIEEPSPGGARTLAALRGPLPIAADESMRTEADLEQLISHRSVDVVVIKPMFVGGPQVATRLARRAHDAGLGVVISTALESGIGRLAALHVAAVNPSSLAAGLDAAHLFERDLGTFPSSVDGMLSLP